MMPAITSRLTMPELTMSIVSGPFCRGEESDQRSGAAGTAT